MIRLTRQASLGIKTFTIISFCALFLLSFNGVSSRRAKFNSAPWIACIKHNSNSLHFRSLNDKTLSEATCSGQTSYAVSGPLDLIDNLNNDSLFGELRPGTRRVLKLDNGRRFSLSQWKNQSNSNYVLVLEPNLAKKKVRKVCVIKNHSEMMSARYDSRRKSIQVRVATDTQSNGAPSGFKWKSCKI